MCGRRDHSHVRDHLCCMLTIGLVVFIIRIFRSLVSRCLIDDTWFALRHFKSNNVHLVRVGFALPKNWEGFVRTRNVRNFFLSRKTKKMGMKTQRKPVFARQRCTPNKHQGVNVACALNHTTKKSRRNTSKSNAARYVQACPKKA